jgi:hypothetical protein
LKVVKVVLIRWLVYKHRVAFDRQSVSLTLDTIMATTGNHKGKGNENKNTFGEHSLREKGHSGQQNERYAGLLGAAGKKKQEFDFLQLMRSSEPFGYIGYNFGKPRVIRASSSMYRFRMASGEDMCVE